VRPERESRSGRRQLRYPLKAHFRGMAATPEATPAIEAAIAALPLVIAMTKVAATAAAKSTENSTSRPIRIGPRVLLLMTGLPNYLWPHSAVSGLFVVALG